MMTLINKEKLIEKFNTQIEESINPITINSFKHAINIVHMTDIVEHYSITEPKDYEEYFSNAIYKMLRDMCIVKGIELDGSDEILEDIRDSIIRHADNYNMDLSVPQKEYKLGDKVKVIDDGEYYATIVYDNDSKRFGLLTENFTIKYSIGEYQYEVSRYGVPDVKNYMIYLERCGITVE